MCMKATNRTLKVLVIQEKWNKLFPGQRPEAGYLLRLEDDDSQVFDHWRGRLEVNVIEICSEEMGERRDG